MPDLVARLNAALEGRYAIERELGEGGMATVYLADDVKHGRKVALKVLKPELAAIVGAERFLAEIKTTANLQHPNILALFDSGEADGLVYYVMPYVEGETLRDRIDRERQLPVDEAVRIASAVAGGLQTAHDQGIIHRDIKPANILLSRGEPLVADFGISLAVDAAGGKRLTETGLSLGTPYYMSPEQATGDQFVGPATDTYALGAVLYEMLAGDPPYPGSTAQAVLGRIIAGKPVSAAEQRPSVPANVDAAVRCALEKLPADRFPSARDFQRALGDEHFRYGEVVAEAAGGAVGPWNRLTMGLLGTTVLLAFAFGWSLLHPPPPAPLARFSLAIEEGQIPLGGLPDFTADGSGLVYVGPGASGQGSQLWMRRWADLDATPVRGTEGVVTFALSPDGREVAFVAGFPAPLRVVAFDVGASRTLVELVFTVSDWAADGTVHFNTVNPAVLARVPATGGGSDAVEVLTELLEGETIHGVTTVLPGGKMGVFEVWYAQSGEDAEIWAIDLDTRERRFLTVGGTPRYASTGHLLFATPDGALMAAPIDPGSAELALPAVQVAEGLAVDRQFGLVTYAVSEGGTLVYGAGNDQEGATELVWVTRQGDAAPVDAGWRFNPAAAGNLWSLSPDATRVALTRLVNGNVDIWIKQLPDGPFERLTFDDEDERYPVWTPDGQFVTYVRNESGGNFDVWRRRADGTGAPRLLLDDERSLYEGRRGSLDGEWMVFRTTVPVATFGERDIVAFRPGVDSTVIPLVANADFVEQSPALSPDGRWLAYTSDETGREKVYVTPFPDVDSDKVQVSTDGGSVPLWAHSGAELFFVDAQRRLIAAQVGTASGFRVLERETLFFIGPEYGLVGSVVYDVAADDQRFLMGRLAGAASSGAGGFILVQNWFQELKERLGS